MGGGQRAAGREAVKIAAAGRKEIVWRGLSVPSELGELIVVGQVLMSESRYTPEDFFRELPTLINDGAKAKIEAFLAIALDGRFSSAELKGLIKHIAPVIRVHDAKGAHQLLRSIADELSKEA